MGTDHRIDKRKLIDWIKSEMQRAMDSLSEEDKKTESIMIAMGSGMAAFTHVIDGLNKYQFCFEEGDHE